MKASEWKNHITSGLLLCGTILLVSIAGFYSTKASRSSSSSGHRIDDQDANADESTVCDAADTNRSILIVTRVHTKSASSLADPAKVVKFIRDALLLADGVLVCLGAADGSILPPNMEDLNNRIQALGISKGKYKLLPVSPWGYFVSSLNAAVQYAQDEGFARIGFQVLKRCKNIIHLSMRTGHFLSLYLESSYYCYF